MASRCRLLSTTSLLLVLLILVPGPARSHGDHDHGDHDHGDHDHDDHDHGDHDHDHDMEPHLDDDVEDDMDLNIDGDPELDDVDTKQPEPPAAPKVVYKAPHPIGDTYFVDSFDSGTLDNWVISKAKKEDTDEDIAKYDGKWLVEEQLDGKLPDDKGLVLKTRAKHHAIAGALTRPFHFIDKPLIVQYEVNFQNGIECGGAYVKLLSGNADLDLTKFYDKTPYTIMFGPDKCGEDYKLHFIMRHRNPKTGTYEEKHAKKSDVDLKSYYTDKKPHLYTLVLSPDNRYEILIDQTVVGSGSLLEDMTPPVNPAREIEDPDDSKPEDWDERAKIPDPDAIKPEDWDEDAPAQISDPDAVKPEGWLDDEPEYTADPEAVKPEDWDEEMDGEWEAPQVPNPTCEAAPGCGVWKAPMVSNPAYKGKWKPANIDNPNYQGVWKPRKIANPDFFEDLHPFRLTAFNAIGLELWSMTSDILFDNFIVCSERAVADQWAADSWGLKRQAAAADEPGIVMKLYQAAEERPWLWAVYVFTVALPIVLLVSFCWPSKKFGPPDESDPKKTDEPQPDDPEKEEEEAEDEEDEEEDEAAEEGAGDTADGAAKKGGSDTEGGKSGEEEDAAAADEQEEKPRNKAAKSKADLEADDEQVQASDGDAGKTSPRKRKARKE